MTSSYINQQHAWWTSRFRFKFRLRLMTKYEAHRTRTSAALIIQSSYRKVSINEMDSY